MKIGLGIGLINKSTTGGGIPPAIASATISGTAVVGQTLTASASGVTGIPIPTLSYQWKRGATNIGTNSSTYTLVQADAGNTSNITCVVTATNSAGSANATSNQIAQILTVRTSAFLTASAISDATIRGGLNTFDIGLIANSLDTKMKAVYPFVTDAADNNSRALQHRWNFMDARDTNAAFRLSFIGTWTHSSNGAKPNGTNAFANTYLSLTSLTQTNTHLSYYSRTVTDVTGFPTVIGAFGNSSYERAAELYIRRPSASNNGGGQIGSYTTSQVNFSEASAQRYSIISRTSSTSLKYYSNNVLRATNTTSDTTGYGNFNIFLGAANGAAVSLPNGVNFSQLECAFATIGDGLTDTDATNMYNLTQALQTTLGRSVGPQTVSDPDAQAFVTAADIQDQVQADAVNTLVIGMKAQGLWTKMKALYPFVGGTATSHMYNLKDPRNLDAAFRLQFTGGWNHSSLGALPNGSNTLANTYLVPNLTLNTNDHALFFYLNTNNSPISADPLDSGYIEGVNSRLLLYSRLDGFGGTADSGITIAPYASTLAGFALITKQSATVTSVFRNATKVATGVGGGTPPPINPPKVYPFLIGNVNINGTPYGVGWSNNRFAMYGITEAGLSDADSVNLYNLTQTFQTTLGRQINP